MPCKEEETNPGPAADLMGAARRTAAVLEGHASQVDEAGAFPAAGVNELKKSGLMGLLVPQEYGGWGASVEAMAEVAGILAGSCLSTGMIWAMHCQQVAVIADHAPESLKRRILPQVAAGAFIASVTTESGKGGHLLTAQAPIFPDGEDVLLHRAAPVVTGGAHADGYLITMRAGELTPPTQVVLVYADRSHVDVALQGRPSLLGMRGTDSCSLLLEGRVPKDHVISPGGGFRRVAVVTMIPVGHIAWAACWLGAARAALRRMLGLIRNPKTRSSFDLESDLFVAKLARVRLHLDVVSAYLHNITRLYERIRCEQGLESEELASPGFNIKMNNLKIMASEYLFEAVHQLMQIGGLSYGYSRNEQVPLERVFRDLSSASLMYNNHRLWVANGKLTLLDREVSLT